MGSLVAVAVAVAVSVLSCPVLSWALPRRPESSSVRAS